MRKKKTAQSPVANHVPTANNNRLLLLEKAVLNTLTAFQVKKNL